MLMTVSVLDTNWTKHRCQLLENKQSVHAVSYILNPKNNRTKELINTPPGGMSGELHSEKIHAKVAECIF